MKQLVVRQHLKSRETLTAVILHIDRGEWTSLPALKGIIPFNWGVVQQSVGPWDQSEAGSPALGSYIHMRCEVEQQLQLDCSVWLDCCPCDYLTNMERKNHFLQKWIYNKMFFFCYYTVVQLTWCQWRWGLILTTLYLWGVNNHKWNLTALALKVRMKNEGDCAPYNFKCLHEMVELVPS